MAIRAGSGLGDSIYLQSIARHLLLKGHQVEVCTDWPDVFRPLFPQLRVSQFRRENIQRVAHYTARKQVKGTDQFQDMCVTARIHEPVELRLDWKPIYHRYSGAVREAKKPVILVQLPRAPMGRVDGFGAELLPDCRVIQRVIGALNGRAHLVQVGSGAPLYRFEGINLNLANRTSVADLIDLASVAHGFLGYVSFIVPLAESLNKPALLVWSRRGLNSTERRADFIRAITPQKILHKPSSRAIIDDCADDEVRRAADELLDASAACRALPG